MFKIPTKDKLYTRQIKPNMETGESQGQVQSDQVEGEELTKKVYQY